MATPARRRTDQAVLHPGLETYPRLVVLLFMIAPSIMAFGGPELWTSWLIAPALVVLIVALSWAGWRQAGP
jgi:hypothetical protein